MKKYIRYFVFVVLLFVFIGSGILLFSNFKDSFQNHQLEEQFNQEKQELIENQNDFSELLITNDETIGWISIDGTSIDYPIVQTSDNSYYLTHDFNHSDSKQGSIFMDYRNNSEFGDIHTILYGHNMKNGTMFHALNDYSNQVFFEEHPFIETFSPDGYRKWSIFSTYNTDTDFNYLQIKFATISSYEDFLNTILSKSDFHNQEIQVIKDDHILTLSTCSDDYENGRRVVHAKLIEEVINNE
ncbi:class B sortase [Bacillus sp. AGMB 02131]|uniref:Class B sortase n=1 Tax=Peribacillus faecalis TaxID=2772559 RepID=A0A927CVT1_9BACI|nr:class B sortase [Peribacillus faecalis]MBD3108538.1 class B sortase [Peribacillus faecalis]